MTTLWAWFIGTRVGRWCIGLATVVAGLVAAWLLGHHKGAKAQAAQDDAREAKSLADAAQNAVDTANAASAAAAAVQATAAQRPPPNTVKRDDFDSTF